MVVKFLERIDVIMCTYNSNKPYFHTVLQRIFEEVPVHCFIVVDRFSSDGTVSRVLDVFPKAKVVRSLENLGRARKIGIDIVDTSFFAFIDDDVELFKGWYKYVKGLMGNRIGAVASFAKEKSPLARGTYYATRPRLVVSSKNNVDSQRGYTYATLMKKEAVATWKPDGTLTAGEDHEILRHVVNRGFLWLTSYFVLVEHLRPDQHYFDFFSNIWMDVAWNAAGRRYVQVIKLNPAQLMFQSVLMVWAGIKTSIMFRNAFLSLYYFVYSLAFFYGYVCWKKKLFRQR
jgi:glycosyltransferase involved in cell wall biosynthesis